MSSFLPEGSTLDDGGKFDAGSGFRYTPYYRDAELTQLDGVWFWHPCSIERGSRPGPNGRTNEKWDYTNVDTPERLTIRASILCMECQFHGFLTEGVWANV